MSLQEEKIPPADWQFPAFTLEDQDRHEVSSETLKSLVYQLQNQEKKIKLTTDEPPYKVIIIIYKTFFLYFKNNENNFPLWDEEYLRFYSISNEYRLQKNQKLKNGITPKEIKDLEEAIKKSEVEDFTNLCKDYFEKTKETPWVLPDFTNPEEIMTEDELGQIHQQNLAQHYINYRLSQYDFFYYEQENDKKGNDEKGNDEKGNAFLQGSSAYWKKNTIDFIKLVNGLNIGQFLGEVQDSISSINKENPLWFIYEVLQNADDCFYHTDKPVFEIDFSVEDKMIIHYDEVGMTNYDVLSICSLRNSTKKNKVINPSIGEKGIGFKTLFHHFDQVLIHSGGYQFKLGTNTLNTNKSIFNPESWNHAEIEACAPILNDQSGSGTYLIFSVSEEDKKNHYNTLLETYGLKRKKMDFNQGFQHCPILFTQKISEMKVTWDKSTCFGMQRSCSPYDSTDDCPFPIDLQYNLSENNLSGNKFSLPCIGMKKDVFLRYEEFKSRFPISLTKEKYDEDYKFKLPIVALLPLDSSVKGGCLYSFLPTNTMISAPLSIQLPVKLNQNRTCPDTTEGKLWLDRMLAELRTIVGTFYQEISINPDLLKNDDYEGNVFSYIPEFKNKLLFTTPLKGINDELSKNVKAFNDYCSDLYKFFDLFQSIPYFKVIGENKFVPLHEAFMLDVFMNSFESTHMEDEFLNKLKAKYPNTLKAKFPQKPLYIVETLPPEWVEKCDCLADKAQKNVYWEGVFENDLLNDLWNNVLKNVSDEDIYQKIWAEIIKSEKNPQDRKSTFLPILSDKTAYDYTKLEIFPVQYVETDEIAYITSGKMETVKETVFLVESQKTLKSNDYFHFILPFFDYPKSFSENKIIISWENTTFPLALVDGNSQALLDYALDAFKVEKEKISKKKPDASVKKQDRIAKWILNFILDLSPKQENKTIYQVLFDLFLNKEDDTPSALEKEDVCYKEYLELCKQGSRLKQLASLLFTLLQPVNHDIFSMEERSTYSLYYEELLSLFFHIYPSYPLEKYFLFFSPKHLLCSDHPKDNLNPLRKELCEKLNQSTFYSVGKNHPFRFQDTSKLGWDYNQNDSSDSLEIKKFRENMEQIKFDANKIQIFVEETLAVDFVRFTCKQVNDPTVTNHIIFLKTPPVISEEAELEKSILCGACTSSMKQYVEEFLSAEKKIYYIISRDYSKNKPEDKLENLQKIQEIRALSYLHSGDNFRDLGTAPTNNPLYELLQNADDKIAGGTLYIDVSDPKNFLLSYPERENPQQEKGFQIKDFYAISASGYSGNFDYTAEGERSHNNTATGRKGTGFRSMYNVFDKIEIDSYGIHCLFDDTQKMELTKDKTGFHCSFTDYAENDTKHDYPVPQFSLSESVKEKTTFTFHFKDKGLEDLNLVIPQMEDDFFLANKQTYFLNQIDKFNITTDQNTKHCFCKSDFLKKYFYAYQYDPACPGKDLITDFYANKNSSTNCQRVEMLFPKETYLQKFQENNGLKCNIFVTLPIDHGESSFVQFGGGLAPFLLNCPAIPLGNDRSNFDTAHKDTFVILMQVFQGFQTIFKQFAEEHVEIAYRYFPNPQSNIFYLGEKFPQKVYGDDGRCSFCDNIPFLRGVTTVNGTHELFSLEDIKLPEEKKKAFWYPHYFYKFLEEKPSFLQNPAPQDLWDNYVFPKHFIYYKTEEKAVQSLDIPDSSQEKSKSKAFYESLPFSDPLVQPEVLQQMMRAYFGDIKVHSIEGLGHLTISNPPYYELDLLVVAFQRLISAYSGPQLNYQMLKDLLGTEYEPASDFLLDPEFLNNLLGKLFPTDQQTRWVNPSDNVLGLVCRGLFAYQVKALYPTMYHPEGKNPEVLSKLFHENCLVLELSSEYYTRSRRKYSDNCFWFTSAILPPKDYIISDQSPSFALFRKIHPEITKENQPSGELIEQGKFAEIYDLDDMMGSENATAYLKYLKPLALTEQESIVETFLKRESPVKKWNWHSNFSPFLKLYKDLQNTQGVTVPYLVFTKLKQYFPQHRELIQEETLNKEYDNFPFFSENGEIQSGPVELRGLLEQHLWLCQEPVNSDVSWVLAQHKVGETSQFVFVLFGESAFTTWLEDLFQYSEYKMIAQFSPMISVPLSEELGYDNFNQWSEDQWKGYMQQMSQYNQKQLELISSSKLLLRQSPEMKKRLKELLAESFSFSTKEQGEDLDFLFSGYGLGEYQRKTCPVCGAEVLCELTSTSVRPIIAFSYGEKNFDRRFQMLMCRNCLESDSYSKKSYLSYQRDADSPHLPHNDRSLKDALLNPTNYGQAVSLTFHLPQCQPPNRSYPLELSFLHRLYLLRAIFQLEEQSKEESTEVMEQD
ncbi:MAG: hypothetical protein R3Y63_07975 [Eubacteriales bacterium]